MAQTQNIKPFDEQNTGNAAGTKVAKHPLSRPGLYYGTDGLIKDKTDPKGKRMIEDPKTFKKVKGV